MHEISEARRANTADGAGGVGTKGDGTDCVKLGKATTTADETGDDTAYAVIHLNEILAAKLYIELRLFSQFPLPHCLWDLATVTWVITLESNAISDLPMFVQSRGLPYWTAIIKAIE